MPACRGPSPSGYASAAALIRSVVAHDIDPSVERVRQELVKCRGVDERRTDPLGPAVDGANSKSAAPDANVTGMTEPTAQPVVGGQLRPVPQSHRCRELRGLRRCRPRSNSCPIVDAVKDWNIAGGAVDQRLSDASLRDEPHSG